MHHRLPVCEQNEFATAGGPTEGSSRRAGNHTHTMAKVNGNCSLLAGQFKHKGPES